MPIVNFPEGIGTNFIPIELIIGKTIPFALVGVADLVLVTVAAILIFHIPFQGSALLLLFCSILFLMTSLGAGLFISTISNTQQQAMMSSFFFSMPAFMLSGFTFPILPGQETQTEIYDTTPMQHRRALGTAIAE